MNSFCNFAESLNSPTDVDWTTLWTNSTTQNWTVVKSGWLKKEVVAAAAVEAVPVVQLPGPNPVLAPGLDPVLKDVRALPPAGAAPDPEDPVEHPQIGISNKHFCLYEEM